MSRRYLSGIATVLLVLMIIRVPAQVPPKQRGAGEEWLSWSPAERGVYILGFTDGYTSGSLGACNVTDQLFEVGKPHRLGDAQHPTEIPSGRCLAAVENYSRNRHMGSDPTPYTTAYTTVITEFYTKHPEYQGVPFFYLMLNLSDSKYKTAEELYQMALRQHLEIKFRRY